MLPTVLCSSDMNSPSADALVVVVDPAGGERELRTDAEGNFVVTDLVPGRYRLDVSAADGSTLSSEEDVEAGVEVVLVLRPTPAASADEDAELGARAVVDPPPREVTRRTLPREVLSQVAGTRGDPLRTIELIGRHVIPRFQRR